MNVGSTSSYRRAPGETTEWEDILVSKGIIAPKTDPEEEKRQAALEERLEAAAAAVDPLKGLSLSELDELEVRAPRCGCGGLVAVPPSQLGAPPAAGHRGVLLSCAVRAWVPRVDRSQ
jgi:hypothetical protein